MESPVLKIVLQRGDADCCIAALAMYLGRTYEDVLGVAAQLHPEVHKRGMWIREVKAVAIALGTPLRVRRKWDMDTASGIMSLDSTKYTEAHVVVLRAGLVFDTDGCVWDPDVFFVVNNYKAQTLLERRDE